MGLFKDRYAEQKDIEKYERQVNRMRPPKVTSSHHPKGKAAPAPYPCPNGCGSTVRGGVCPSPEC